MLGRVLRAYRSAFTGLPRDVWLLAGATLVNRAGTMVLPFLTLYLTGRRGLTAAQAGSVLSLWGLGSLGGSYLGGWLSDRVGAVRVQQGSLLATGAGFLVLARLEGHAAIAACVFTLALFGEAFRPALMTAVTQASPPALAARSLALLRMAINLGMTAGPAVGGLLAVRHYQLLFVVDALTCWAAALLLAIGLRRRSSAALDRATARRRSPWRDPPFLAFLGLVTLLALAFFQILSTFPLYLRAAYGLSEDRIGLLFALNAAGIVAFEMVLLHAIERRNHARIAALGSLLVCTGFALLPLGRSALFAAFTVIVWTAGEMLSLPLSNAIAATRASGPAGGSYMGAYTLAFSLGFVVAPALGTRIYQTLGPEVLWASVGALGLILFVGFHLLAPRLAASGVGTERRGDAVGTGETSE